jgi:hypothetical protein
MGVLSCGASACAEVDGLWTMEFTLGLKYLDVNENRNQVQAPYGFHQGRPTRRSDVPRRPALGEN